MADTFVIDKSRTFVSGLFWQPLSGSQSEFKKLTKKLVNELNAQAQKRNINAPKLDLAIWRTSPALQVGLGTSADGIKPGMLSAAAVISKGMESISSERDFLCAVEVPIGWLYVAQREGVILYNGDIVGHEDAIKSRLLGDMSLGSWSTVIAPDDWGIRGSINGKTFADFLPKVKGKYDYKKWWKIQPIDRWASASANPLKSLTPLLMIGSIILGGAWGYKTWQQHQMAIEAARLAAMNVDTNTPAAKPEHPWKKEALAPVFVSACIKSLNGVKSVWPGNWEPQEANCTNGNFSLTWKAKDYGWMQHLKAVEPNAMISPDGKSATLTLPLELPQDSSDEVVPIENARSFEMSSIAQRYGFSLVLAAPATQPPTLPGQQAATAPVKDWNEIKWSTAATLLPPETIISILDGKGFRVNKIQAIFSNGLISWNMEGVQYVQP